MTYDEDELFPDSDDLDHLITSPEEADFHRKTCTLPVCSVCAEMGWRDGAVISEEDPRRQELPKELEEPDACPTCGATGPDVITLDYDAGMPEAACGDAWHDAPTPEEMEQALREFEEGDGNGAGG